MAGWVLNRVSSTSPLIMSRSATASVPWQEKATDIKPICAAGVEVNCKNKRQTGTFNSCKSKRFRVYPWKLSTANNLFVFSLIDWLCCHKSQNAMIDNQIHAKIFKNSISFISQNESNGLESDWHAEHWLRYMKPLKSTLHNGCFFCWTYEAFQLVNTSRGPYWLLEIDLSY